MKYIITILLGLVALTSQAQKKTYEYDEIQRLSKINAWSGSTVAHSIVYSYDELGNRTSKVITTGSCQTAIATLTGTQSITSGSVATLTVSFTGAMPYSFVFNGQTYSNINVSSYSLTVSPTQNTTYTLNSVSNSCGTGSVSGEAIVTVTTPCSGVATPIITATPSVVAVGQSAILSVANCSGTVNWFNSNTSTTSLASGNTYTTPALSNTTIYYADCSNNGCTSTARGSQTVSVNNCGTQTGNANPSVIYAGSNSTITLNGCAGTVTWSENLGSGNTKTVSPVATTVYIATCSASGCPSSSTSVRVTVNCNTSPTPSISSANILSGQTATLSATGCSGTIYWWDAATSANYLGTGTTYITPALTTTTNYYATCVTNNCESIAGTGTVTVSTITPLSSPLLVSPLNVSSLPYTTTVNLQWSANGNPAGTTYYPKLRDLTTGLLVFDYTNVGSATSYTATVVPGHNYRWVVQAQKAGYTNGDSQEFTFSIQVASYNLELGSCIVVSPNPLVQEQNKSFTYSVKNSGNANFVGTIKLTINRPNGTTDVVDEHLNITITPNQTVSYSTAPNNLSSTTNPVGTNYQFAVVAFINGTGGGAAVNSISGCNNPLITSVIATPNCITPTVPSVTINNGQTATLTASNCSGTVNWFTQSTGGSSVFTGNPFTTPTLTATTSYYAECTSNNCTSTTRGSGTITVNQPTITLGTLASTNYCISNIISVPFTTTLPAGTTFTATLKKGTTIIQSVSGTSSPLSIFIPYNQSVVYGTDYTIQITSGTNSSTVSPNISIGDLWSASITDANNHDIYYTSSDYLCSGKTKIYYATVKDIWGNVISNGINYQWKKDGVEILGATTNTLTVSGSGTYSVLVTQASCSRSSNNVTLQSINSNTTTIVYGDAVACAGTSKRVESSYYSNTATYQWQRDGVIISGAVNRTYDATQSGLYKVITTDGTCTNTTSEQRLTFGTGLLASIGNGNDTTLCGTNSPYLYASNTYLNSSQYTYQWKKDGVNISGATNYYYNAPQAGVYSVTYTQGACSSTSRGITIVSSTLAQKPVITAGSITNICNGSIIINQNINGNYGYLYGTWYKDGVMVNSATNYQYVANTSGSYKMVYGSGACANESNTVTVNIGSTFTPKIYIPAYYGKTNLCGTGDYLYIYFDNQNLSGGVYTYQWQKDGVNIAGETNQYLYVTTAGNYTLSVSNGSCSGISNGIIITNNTPVTYLTASENNTSCTNKAIRLDLKGANSYYFTPVVWKKDGVIISGETSSFLYTNQAGVYTATYNQNGCSGTSLPIYINTGTRQPAAIPPVFINSGQTGTLTVSGCTGTVNWYNTPTGGNSLGTGFSFTSPPLTLTTLYYADCSVNNCVSSFRASGAISVNCLNMYSLKTGNWNDISVWSCGRLPNSSDTVTISSGNTVTIPSGQTGLLYNLIQKGILVSNGLLKFGN